MAIINTFFHETYGEISHDMFVLVQENNVSPADYDMLTDVIAYDLGVKYNVDTFRIVENHIQYYSENGMYREPFPMNADAVLAAQ